MTSNGAQQHNETTIRLSTLSTACFIVEDPPNPHPQEPINDITTIACKDRCESHAAQSAAAGKYTERFCIYWTQFAFNNTKE
jgi:hypothetical protein